MLISFRLPCFEREFTANLRQTVWMEDDIQGFLSSVKNTTGFYKDLSFSLPASDGKGFNVTDAAQRGVVQKTISVVRVIIVIKKTKTTCLCLRQHSDNNLSSHNRS